MAYEKVVVTGGSGRLGRHVVAQLAGRRLSVLDIAPAAADQQHHRIDILDLPGLQKAFAGQEAVIHLAGYDDGDAPCEQDYIRVNLQGAWNVFQAAEDAGVRKLVVASSSAAFGLGRNRAPDRLPVDESHPLRATGTYGHSKQLIEAMAQHYVGRGRLEVVCLRPTLIVRPEREAAILAQLALPDPEKDPPPDSLVAGVAPYGALSVTRSYVRSVDAARCFRLALDGATEPFEIFNVAAPDTIGRVETLDQLRRAYGRLPPLADAAVYDADPCASPLDSRRARDRLGWACEGDWRAVAAAHSPSKSENP